MPAFKPEQSRCIPHASVSSSPQTAMMHFPIIQKRISTIPAGQMPRHLSKAMSLPAMRAQYAAQACP
eukprot:11150172-Ditylum_brightwellii.AAC.1